MRSSGRAMTERAWHLISEFSPWRNPICVPAEGSHRRTTRDERSPHVENDRTAKAKETLIAGLGYSAPRAGRSAGRSLSWHGRGRGFKSHPVHFSMERSIFKTAKTVSRQIAKR